MAYEQMSDILQKIKRADKHIGDFHTDLATFVGSRPYALRVDVESDPANPTIHVLKADPVPPPLLCTVGDALHNLRSALDHLACELVRSNGNRPTQKTEFPILSGPTTTRKIEAQFNTKVEGMSKQVIDAIWQINPYHGGDDTLWRLHRLDVIDKHKMLLAAFGNITAVDGLPPIEDQWDGNRWGNIPGVPLILEKGQKFKIPDAKVGKTSSFFAEIVFNEPNVAEGYPVVLALRQFHRKVVMTIGQLSWALK